MVQVCDRRTVRQTDTLPIAGSYKTHYVQLWYHDAHKNYLVATLTSIQIFQKVHESLIDDITKTVSSWLVAWYSGRTSVFDRRTFPVLRSTYRPTALEVSQLGQLSLSSFGGRYVSNKLQLDGRHHQSVVAPSSERLRGKGRHGVVCR